MAEDIYDPLEEYVSVFRDRFQQVARDTFAALAAEARVDVEANHVTCKCLYEAEKALHSIKSSIGWATALCVVLWRAECCWHWRCSSSWCIRASSG